MRSLRRPVHETTQPKERDATTMRWGEGFASVKLLGATGISLGVEEPLLYQLSCAASLLLSCSVSHITEWLQSSDPEPLWKSIMITIWIQLP